jgi:ABC-type Fe3+ transport system substrate-binding protein
MTLDQPARAAVGDGSPIDIVWPASGAIALYSPIAVVDASHAPGAEPFVDYVLGVEAQNTIAGTGWQPVRSDVGWTDAGPRVTVDWRRAFAQQDQLLSSYQAVFGG